LIIFWKTYSNFGKKPFAVSLNTLQIAGLLMNPSFPQNVVNQHLINLKVRLQKEKERKKQKRNRLV